MFVFLLLSGRNKYDSVTEYTGDVISNMQRLLLFVLCFTMVSAGNIGTIDYSDCTWHHTDDSWLYCEAGYVAVGECLTQRSAKETCFGYTQGIHCCKLTKEGITYFIYSTLNYLTCWKRAYSIWIKVINNSKIVSIV